MVGRGVILGIVLFGGFFAGILIEPDWGSLSCGGVFLMSWNSGFLLGVREVGKIGLLGILFSAEGICSKGKLAMISGEGIVDGVFRQVFAGLADLDLGEVNLEFGDEGFGVEFGGEVIFAGLADFVGGAFGET
jgi:hypothetical protein